MFIDVAKIKIKAGDGGNGAVAFHREKYVAAGGNLTAVTAAAAAILSSRWIPICLLWLTSAIKENIWLQTAKMEEKTAVTEKMQKIW